MNSKLSDQLMIREIYFFLLLYFYSIIDLISEIYFRILRFLSIKESLFDDNKLYNDLSGCVCLINGAANGSIGSLVIPKLLKRKCYLIITLHGDKKLRDQTIKNLKNDVLKDIDSSLYSFEYADFSSIDSIVKLINKLNKSSQKINFFISNAGIAMRDYCVTENNFESQLQINYLSGALLLIGLFPLIVKTAKLAKENNEPKSKILFTNSCVHKYFDFDLNLLDKATNNYQNNFITHQIYSISKLYQIMFNVYFHDKFIKDNNLDELISFINVHPGIIDSNLFDYTVIKKKLKPIYNLIALLLKKPEEGAINISIPILSSDQLFNSTDVLYLNDLKISKMKMECYDNELKYKLFKKTIKLLESNINEFKDNLPNQFNPLIDFQNRVY